jgi:hypothetical protein
MIIFNISVFSFKNIISAKTTFLFFRSCIIIIIIIIKFENRWYFELDQPLSPLGRIVVGSLGRDGSNRSTESEKVESQ